MTSKVRNKPKAAGYPRDLVGYGKRLPDPKWPGGARLALQISLNYEAGGELNLLHGDRVSEATLNMAAGAACGGCCACSKSARS